MGSGASAPIGVSAPRSTGALESWTTDDVIAALEPLGCSKFADAVADQNVDGCAVKLIFIRELERLQQKYDAAQAVRRRDQKAAALRTCRSEMASTASPKMSDNQRKAARARQGSCTAIASFDDLSSSQTDWAQPCQVSPPRMSTQRGDGRGN